MFIQYKEGHDIRNILYVQGMTENEKKQEIHWRKLLLWI